jgi:hypothetical protein
LVGVLEFEELSSDSTLVESEDGDVGAMTALVDDLDRRPSVLETVRTTG